jgi:hypothetical protein
MENYQNWFLYKQYLPLNIEGMYTHLGGKNKGQGGFVARIE